MEKLKIYPQLKIGKFWHPIHDIKRYSQKMKIFEGNIKEITKELETDKGYCEITQEKHIIYGDLDGFEEEFDNFSKQFIKFMKLRYNIIISKDDFAYTKNNNKKDKKNNTINSYHFSIPKYNLSRIKLLEIMQNFINDNDNNIKLFEKSLDVSIYKCKNRLFRLPNQSKPEMLISNLDTRHIIQRGEMKNFVVNYIPKYSTDICDVDYIGTKREINKIKKIITIKEEEEKIIKEDKKKNTEKDNEKIFEISNINKITDEQQNILSIIEEEIYYELLDNICEKQDYDTWIKYGFAFYNRYGDYGFKFFKYISNKSQDSDTDEELIKKYNTMKNKDKKNKITIATLWNILKKKDEKKFKNLLKKQNTIIDLSCFQMCKFIKSLYPNNFISKRQGESDDYLLYYYNGKIWTLENSLIINLFHYEIIPLIKEIINNFFFDKKNIKKLDKIKTVGYERDLIITMKHDFIDENIKFDEKNLYAFKNKVFDCDTKTLRDFKYDDYITKNTGYDYIEPSQKNYDELIDFIKKIVSDKDERYLLQSIYGSIIENMNKCYFICMTGQGSNGKSSINKLAMISVGNKYSYVASNNLIVDTKVQEGANQSLSNCHLKRLVLIQELSAKLEISNSKIKEITGNRYFNARSLHEKNCQKISSMTLLIESNILPKLNTTVTLSEERRMINFCFRNTFTTNKKLVNNINIFQADKYYESDDFYENHKCSFFKFMMEGYKNFCNDGKNLKMTPKMQKETFDYLNGNSKIYLFMDEFYDYTSNKDDYVTINDMYNLYCSSKYYLGLNNDMKSFYSKNKFIEEIKTNNQIQQNFVDRKQINKKRISNIMVCYKLKKEEENEECENDYNDE